MNKTPREILNWIVRQGITPKDQEHFKDCIEQDVNDCLQSLAEWIESHRIKTSNFGQFNGMEILDENDKGYNQALQDLKDEVLK